MVLLDLSFYRLIWAAPLTLAMFAGAYLWPGLLAVAGVAVLVGCRRRGWRRAAWLGFAGLLVADCLVFRVLA